MITSRLDNPVQLIRTMRRYTEVYTTQKPGLSDEEIRHAQVLFIEW